MRTTTAPAPTRNNRTKGNAQAILLRDAEKLFGRSVDSARERYNRLTPREIEVARLMASGKKNRQIAEELGISPKTLDIHRANLVDKLEARTATDVANLINLLRFAELAEALGG